MQCIICDKALEMVNKIWNLPKEAVNFYTYGHYGSTVFDPINGSVMNIIVCDDCLIKKSDKTSISGVKNG